MKVIRFDSGACAKTRRYLDSYVSGELLVETNHDVLHHLETCAGCRAEHDAIMGLRGALRDAVKGDEPPRDLEAKVRGRLREYESGRFRATPAMWVAIAAGLVIAIAGGMQFLQQHPSPVFALNIAAQEVFLARVSGALPVSMRPGFGDHVHCTVARKNTSEMKPEILLNPAWAPMEPLLRRLVPAKYELVLAHRCIRKGRIFVHFTFQNQGRLISLIVLKKQDRESFAADQLVPSLREAGVAVYQRNVDAYQVAGFESSAYLAYLVSDLDGAENLQLAGVMAGPLTEFLEKKKS